MNARYEESTAYNNFRMVEIYNFKYGTIERSDYWLKQSDEVIIKLRYKLRQTKGFYGCPLCKTSVDLIRSKRGNWFFRHLRREEGVNCALVDEHMSNSQRRIQQYNARVESEEHKRLKRIIYKYLKNDPKVIGKPEIEKIVKGKVISTKWKRPDVKCKRGHQEFVFEVQISNTWLSDIVARDTFYSTEKTSIIWFFNSFDSCKPTKDLTKADIFYNNPEINLFVLDEEAIDATKKSKNLTFKCYYRKPYPNFQERKVDTIWEHQLVTLDDLIIDSETFKPFVFSFYDKYQEANDALSQHQQKLDELERQKRELERIKEEKRQAKQLELERI